MDLLVAFWIEEEGEIEIEGRKARLDHLRNWIETLIVPFVISHSLNFA